MRHDLEAATTRFLRARARFGPLEILFWIAAFSTIWLLADQAPDPDRDRDLGSVRALARSHPRLCRHHLARTRRLLRGRRLRGGPARQVRDHQRADRRAARIRPRGGGARLCDELPGAARHGPHAADGDARRLARLLRARQSLRRDHRRRRRPPGCHHRADLRHLAVRHVRPHRLHLLPHRALHHVHSGAADRQFAVRAVAQGDQGQSAAQRRGRHRGQLAARRGLHALGWLCRRRRRAAGADPGFRLALDALARTLGRRAPDPHHRRHRLSLWRHLRGADLSPAAGLSLRPHRALLAVLDRAPARRHRLDRPRADRRLDRPGGAVRLAASGGGKHPSDAAPKVAPEAAAPGEGG